MGSPRTKQEDWSENKGIFSGVFLRGNDNTPNRWLPDLGALGDYLVIVGCESSHIMVDMFILFPMIFDSNVAIIA